MVRMKAIIVLAVLMICQTAVLAEIEKFEVDLGSGKRDGFASLTV